MDNNKDNKNEEKMRAEEIKNILFSGLLKNRERDMENGIVSMTRLYYKIYQECYKLSSEYGAVDPFEEAVTISSEMFKAILEMTVMMTDTKE